MLDRDTLNVDMLVCYPGLLGTPSPLTPYIAILCLEHSACCSQPSLLLKTLSSSRFDLSARWTSLSLSVLWWLDFSTPSSPLHVPIKFSENFLGFIFAEATNSASNHFQPHLLQRHTDLFPRLHVFWQHHLELLAIAPQEKRFRISGEIPPKCVELLVSLLAYNIHKSYIYIWLWIL